VTGSRIAAADARRLAAELVDALVADEAEQQTSALRVDGIDLRSALEQQLFFALRDGRRAPDRLRTALGARAAVVAQLAIAVAGAVLTGRRPDPGAGPVVALVREKVHVSSLARIEDELRALTGQPIAILRVGRAARGGVAHGMAPPLWRFMSWAKLRALREHGRRVTALRAGPVSWANLVGSSTRAGELARITSVELRRIALGAAALSAAVEAWRPSILLAFDEVGTWARILPAVAHHHGIPSLDLPHAEAADAEAIAGVAYDRMAVYGPHAAMVLRRAGIAADRIVEIGAPRFDVLADAAEAAQPASGDLPRVVYAGQYPTEALTTEMIADGLRTAIATGASIGGAEIVAVPHPAEPTDMLQRLADGMDVPTDVTLRVAGGELHATLPGAWLLVTCWSNSVLEAALLGVPALTVYPVGAAPVDFAADGLALFAAGPGDAERVAAQILDPAQRGALLDTSRAAVRERIAADPGRASERAAQLIVELQA
jgi:hypothetical protein